MLPNDHFILYYSTYLTHYVIISLPEPKDKSDGFFGLLLVSVKFSHFHLNSSPEPLKSVSTRLGTNSKKEFMFLQIKDPVLIKEEIRVKYW